MQSRIPLLATYIHFVQAFDKFYQNGTAKTDKGTMKMIQNFLDEHYSSEDLASKTRMQHLLVLATPWVRTMLKDRPMLGRNDKFDEYLDAATEFVDSEAYQQVLRRI